jgi:hypothetical protein
MLVRYHFRQPERLLMLSHLMLPFQNSSCHGFGCPRNPRSCCRRAGSRRLLVPRIHVDFLVLLTCSCRRLPQRNAPGLAVQVSQRPRVRRADREVRRGDVCGCQRVFPASCGSILSAHRRRAIVVLSRYGYVIMRKTKPLKRTVFTKTSPSLPSQFQHQ